MPELKLDGRWRGMPDVSTRAATWGHRRRQVSNIRLLLCAVLCVSGTYWGSSLAFRAENSSGAYSDVYDQDPQGFGVAGEGSTGICAEILSRPTDPPLLFDCRRILLYTENFDVDYPPGHARSVDVLVQNSIVKAGPRAFFRVLDINERPTFDKCNSRLLAPRFWVGFADLPGRSLCVRSDEGRVGIIQAEDVTLRGAKVSARLTVWKKS